VTNLDELIERCKAEKKRRKFYDRGKGAVSDLYADITASGIATFCYKRPYRRFGVYRPEGNPQPYTLADARQAARNLQGRIERGEDVSQDIKREKALQQARESLTVDRLAKLYIEHIKVPVPKCGKLLPRVETWETVESHLERFVSPRLGRHVISDVKRSEIATLADDIVEGRFGKPSRSNARHMCMAVSGMFKFAVKKEFVSSNPAILLGEWTNTKKHSKPKKRNLKPIEIKQLWHGLDRQELPHDWRTRLALKFELVTMLRGNEFTPMRKADVHDLDGAHPYILVPVERVKNRKHELKHPLSPLAVEIMREALKDNPTDYVFATVQRGGRLINKPLGRQTTQNCLRDRKDKKNVNPGLCTLLGMTKFTPHDLRRTAATILRAIANPKTNGITMAMISICLDHSVKREDGGGAAVTMEHYVDAEDAELAEKRAVLNVLGEELRHLVGLAQAANPAAARPELAMAA
jgi:integrase